MSIGRILDMCRKDLDIPINSPKILLKDLHSSFILKYAQSKGSYEYIMSAHLRMSGIYWCCGAMDLLGQLDKMDREDILKFIFDECFDEKSGGFRSSEGNDPHLLSTLSAIQLLIMFDALDQLDKNAVSKFVTARVNEDGSVSGDDSNELDTRFSFCALASMYLIGKIDEINSDKIIEYVMKCYNFDGGFGTRPGSESHSGQIYCCLGSLAITGKIDLIDKEKTAEWLAYRQCPSGGLNGRPEKLPDVCYGWWVLSSLAMLKKLHWIDKESLVKFTLASQDDETGGFADRPEDYPDPFHTVFGLSALSLLNEGDLEVIDPVFCITKKRLKNLSFI
ncbi:Geranylgeranyl transferase type-2 subunit beta [Strongyloides ratti]|uniref:Geranylgeranyl transferase type-2 subunit beta n=1 Tax=Strongyloides ratti TaxID=34506 RepID=A0A090LNR5_STRRB|nr:Geranylgeranyl transferase type-2 subunit beta [Strongyloides ratti]CEF69814.1 Geranylgeranyl transferase type-2 subunit beta [Strongyloides ratti]